MNLSIVIPCLNESNTVATCIEKCKDVIKKLDISAEIIVVDNGSSDCSAFIAKKSGAKVFQCQTIGYGAALCEGFKKALGEYVLFVDADDSYDCNQIDKLYNTIIEQNADIIIGSRFKGYIEKNAMPFLHRYIGNPFLTMCLNFLFKTNLSDSQSGMRVFKRNILENIKFKEKGMVFATEFILFGIYNHFKISEIGINFYKDKRGCKGHLRTWQDGFSILIFLLMQRLKLKSHKALIL